MPGSNHLHSDQATLTQPPRLASQHGSAPFIIRTRRVKAVLIGACGQRFWAVELASNPLARPDAPAAAHLPSTTAYVSGDAMALADMCSRPLTFAPQPSSSLYFYVHIASLCLRKSHQSLTRKLYSAGH